MCSQAAPRRHLIGGMRCATAVLVGRYSNGKVWAISAKNSATGTEMFGGSVDEVRDLGGVSRAVFCLLMCLSSLRRTGGGGAVLSECGYSVQA